MTQYHVKHWCSRHADRADPIFSSGHEGNHQTGRHFPGGDQGGKWVEAGVLHGTSPLQLIRQLGSREMVNLSEECRRSQSTLVSQARWEAFWRYLRNAYESCLTECQFADDVAILATPRAGAERARQGYIEVA